MEISSNKTLEMVDPDYAIYDESGEIIGEFDDEGNESFLDGKSPVKSPEKITPKIPADPAVAPQGATDDPKPADPDPENPEYLNHAHFILKSGGYDLDEIEFEDGLKVKIADLTEDQQLNIMTNEFMRMQKEFSETLEGSDSKVPELSEDQQALVDFMGKGGTAKQLAQYILENDPDNAHKLLTDDDLVLESIRKSMPGAEEEDVLEELRILKEAGRVEKRAQLLRKQLGTGEIKFSDISQKHGAFLKASQDKELEEEREEVRQLNEKALSTKEIAGIPIDQAVAKSILKDLVPEQEGGESNFLKNLQSPEKLLRLQFLDRYAEEVFDHISKSAMAEGAKLERERLENEINSLRSQLNLKNQHLVKFSEKPIVSFNSKPTNSRKASTEPFMEDF
jgi:hypothetical protein